MERVEAKRLEGERQIGRRRSERLVGGESDQVERPVVVILEAGDEVLKGKSLSVVHLAYER